MKKITNFICARVRAFPVILAAFAVVDVQSASAQTWSNVAGGNWSIGSNWVGGVAPVSSTTTALTFNSLPGTTSTGIGAVTATNNISISFQLNRIAFVNNSPGLISLAGTNSLRFAGTAPTLTQSGWGPATLSLPIEFAADTTFDGAGDGALTLSGGSAGTGGLTIARTSPSFLATTSSNFANTGWSGAVTLQSGILSVGTTTALGTGPLAIATTGLGLTSTGQLRASATTTLANAVTIAPGAALNILTGSSVLTFSNTVGGGALQIGTPITSATVTLTNANNTLTALNVSNGTLTLSGDGGITTAGLPVTLGRGAILAFSYTGGSGTLTNHLAPTSTLATARGNVTIGSINVAGNPSQQTFATVAGESESLFLLNTQNANGINLTIGDLSRVNRGTFVFRNGGTNVATNTFGTVAGAAPSAALVGGGGAAGTTTRSIFPFIISDTTAAGNGNTFTSYDAGGLSLLNLTTDYAGLSLASQGNPAANNMRLASTQPGLANTATANSLILSAAGLYGYGGRGGSLTLGSGALLATGTASQIGIGTLDFGGAEGQIFSTSTAALPIYSQITGTGGLTISGGSGTTDNNIQLLNAANPFSGLVTINAGRVTVRADSALGNAANQIVLNGGILDAQVFNASIARNITVGTAGGAIGSLPLGGTGSTSAGQRLTLTGALTGSGPLRLNGTLAGSNLTAGTIVLAGDNSGYTGELAIDSGVVQADSDVRLGGGDRLLLSGGTLQATASFATGKILDIDVTSTIRVDTGLTLTANGRINALATSVGLSKIGGGVLELTSTADLSGTTSIGVNPGGGSSVQFSGGDLVLSGGGVLASTSTSTLTISGGGRVVLANGTTNNNDRVNFTPQINDGGIRLEGNASVPTTETLGQFGVNGNSFATVTVAPAGSQIATLAFTSSTNAYATSTSPTTLFSGDGLGITGQSRIQFLGSIAPALTNGIITGAFGFDGTNPGLVTTGAVTGGVGIRLLNSGEYVNAFAGAASTANVHIANPEDISSGQTVNAAYIDGVPVNLSANLALTTGNLLLGPGSVLAGGSLSSATRLTIDAAGTAITDAATITSGLAVPTIIKIGDGRLSLGYDPASNYTQLNVFQGTVIAGPNAIPFGATVALSTGATLDMNSTSAMFSALNGLGTVQLGGNVGTILALTTGSFGGTISGSGSITKGGAGTLRFTTTANVTQPITVYQDTLAFGVNSSGAAAVPLVSGGDITMADGTTLSLSAVEEISRNININVGANSGTVSLSSQTGASTTISGNLFVDSNKTLSLTVGATGQSRLTGVISGNGNLIYAATSNAAISGNNTYTGKTTINTTGTITVGSDTAFGNGGLLDVTANTIFTTTSGSHTIGNPLAIDIGFTFSGVDDLDFSGPITTGTAATQGRTFTVNGSGRLGLTALADGTGGAKDILLVGGGTLSMSGNNTYSGSTTINTGTLLLLGGAQLSGGGAMNVGFQTSKGILGGNGSVSGATTIGSASYLSPGLAAAAGELSFGSGLTFVAGATLLWDLAAETTSGPGTNWDRVSITSGLVTIPLGSQLQLSFVGTATAPALGDAFWRANQRWNNIISLAGPASISGTTFAVDNTAWPNIGQFSTVAAASGSGVDLVWTYTAIPEPAAYGVGTTALLAGMAFLRRRDRREPNTNFS